MSLIKTQIIMIFTMGVMVIALIPTSFYLSRFQPNRGFSNVSGQPDKVIISKITASTISGQSNYYIVATSSDGLLIKKNGKGYHFIDDNGKYDVGSQINLPEPIDTNSIIENALLSALEYDKKHNGLYKNKGDFAKISEIELDGSTTMCWYMIRIGKHYNSIDRSGVGAKFWFRDEIGKYQIGNCLN